MIEFPLRYRPNINKTHLKRYRALTNVWFKKDTIFSVDDMNLIRGNVPGECEISGGSKWCQFVSPIDFMNLLPEHFEKLPDYEAPPEHQEPDEVGALEEVEKAFKKGDITQSLKSKMRASIKSICAKAEGK